MTHITLTPTNQLKPHPRNARKHSKAQVRQIAESIREFGFTNPVLIDKDNVILAGHGRVEAAKMIDLKEVPTLCIEHLSEAQKRSYIIADNRIAEKAEWDKDILALEFQELMEIEAEFSLDITGFSLPEIDLMVHDLDGRDPDEGEEAPQTPVCPVTQLGDLWQLGEHRIFCGDSLKAESYIVLLEGEKAEMVFTDPPYNVPIEGHVSGLGKVRHEEFAMASGEMTEHEFETFLKSAFVLLKEHSSDGSLHFVCMDWRHMKEILWASRDVYSKLLNLCVWSKDNGGMGALYRSQHELVFLFKNGEGKNINNVELGKNGRYRTNVWNYRGVNSLRNGRTEELTMHPTVKPLKMVSDALLDCSYPKGLILDPFGGSGTTLMAAEKTGRRARLLELEPKYVDVTIQRWQELTGKEAMNKDKQKTYLQLKQEVSSHD